MEPPGFYRGSKTSAKAPTKRQRGEIGKLPSGSLRVRVYAGIEPVRRKRHYLTEIIPGRSSCGGGRREGADAAAAAGRRAAQPA